MMIELVEDLESVALRHPDVQEQQVGRNRVDGPDRGCSVARLAGDHDPCHVREQVPQLLACEAARHRR